MEKILLIGGGGHCRSVIDVLEQENRFTIAGVIDKEEFIGREILGYRVIGCDRDLEKLFEEYRYALVTVGHVRSNSLRVKLFNQLKEIGYILPIVISPYAYVSKYATLQEGTVVMHHALINAGAKIAQNCIINSKALVEHDSVVEAHCHISTATVINGGVFVQSNSFVGSNVVTKEYSRVSGFIKAGGIAK